MALKDTWGKVKKRPDPLTSIALTIPVFLIYHLGILVVESRTGVDLVSNTVFGVLKASAPVYVVITLALALVVATVTWIEERRGVSSSVPLTQVVLEGFAFAVVLAALAWGASLVLRTPEPAGVRELGVIDKLVLAAGTGFHEEFIFRALLVTGLGWMLGKVFRMSNKAALGVAIALSSIAFALVHNVGPGSEPFVGDVALFRLVLGVIFAGLYIARGFAVAVYAHVLFEVLGYFVFA
ncbi:MAG TPA: CPBP family intramembrane glutamic endopeptidase [Polyangiales bacterium]|nr:CPBP family intramembrane glutamic endopeptidase [Polyangiales bacterium]